MGKWGREFINWCAGWRRGCLVGDDRCMWSCEQVWKAGWWSKVLSAWVTFPLTGWFSVGHLTQQEMGNRGCQSIWNTVEILDLDRTVHSTSSFALLPGMVNYFLTVFFFLIAHQASRWKEWHFALFPPAVSGMVLPTMYVFITLC